MIKKKQIHHTASIQVATRKDLCVMISPVTSGPVTKTESSSAKYSCKHGCFKEVHSSTQDSNPADSSEWEAAAHVLIPLFPSPKSPRLL